MNKVESEYHVSTKRRHLKTLTSVVSKGVCLICQESIALFKEYKIKRYFPTKHANYATSWEREEKSLKTVDNKGKFKISQFAVINGPIHAPLLTFLSQYGDLEKKNVAKPWYKMCNAQNLTWLKCDMAFYYHLSLSRKAGWVQESMISLWFLAEQDTVGFVLL